MDNELKQELNALKEETVKQTKQNTITYRFYSTKKKIPWLLSGENILPHLDIDDGYFNFVELPATKQFDFHSPFLAEIVADSEDYTYWKVERYTNGTKEKTFYFYTSRILTYLKNAYTLELTLDMYLTHTRNIIKKLAAKQGFIKVNRGSLSTTMLLDNNNEAYLPTYLKALKNLDSAIANGDDSYSQVRKFSFYGLKADGVNVANRYPVSLDGLVVNGLKENFLGGLNPTLFTAGLSISDNIGWGSVQVKDKDGVDRMYYAKPYAKFITSTNTIWELKDTERKTISGFIEKHTKLLRVDRDDTLTPAIDLNKNMINGYFAVFRNIDGTIDCYPIIGKFKALIQLPVLPGETGLTAIQNSSNANTVSTTTIYNKRIYCNYESRKEFTLNNDWDSIYNAFIKNVPSYYTNKSYIGIYRGILPTGEENNKLYFQTEPSLSRERFKIFPNSPAVLCSFLYPIRLMIKLGYSDVANLEFVNDTGNKIEKFKICERGTDLITNYVNLLQPICIGNSEIIPARYCFLGEKANSSTINFSIKMVSSFLDGFYVFLKSDLYNNATYAFSLGGTLPTKTESYQQQLEIINQQKNAGVWSSVGNLLARPINWFSGGFGGSKGGGWQYDSNTVAQLGGQVVVDDDGNRWQTGSSFYTSSATKKNRNKSLSGDFSIGGLGGFIGDAINIWNTVKQSEIAKKNIGLGYLTSTSDDMLSAIVQNTVAEKNAYTSTISQGLFSTGYIKEFDSATRQKYINFYNWYGFNISEYVPTRYINEIDLYVREGNTGFFQIDKDWALMNLSELSDYTDNVVKTNIVNQLSNGIRMKKFN